MTQDTQKKKRQNREYVVELEEPSNHRLAYTLGVLGGLVLAAWLTRGTGGAIEGLLEREAPARARPDTGDAPEPAPSRPGRLRREARDQDELLMLEDAVLDAFLEDELLFERGIDVGAISRGIVELSGSVFTRGEAAHAVAVAQTVQGVATVVNRMEIEAERERLHPRFDTDDGGFEMSGNGQDTSRGWAAAGRAATPIRIARMIRSYQREEAIEQADRAQFADEGHYGWPRVGERDEVQEANRTHYREDELDNQSPYGKHAVPQGNQDDGPPQAHELAVAGGRGPQARRGAGPGGDGPAAQAAPGPLARQRARRLTRIGRGMDG